MANSVNINLDVLFNKLENFVSSKTVVGEAITFGDVILLPLVEVSVGVGAYGCDNTKDAKETGTGGLGAKIIPSAILVINKGNVQLVNIKNQDALNKIIDMAPGLIDNIASKNPFSRKSESENKSDDIDDDIDEILEKENFENADESKVNIEDLSEDNDITII